MTRAKDISKIVTDADLSGTLDVTGTVTAGGLDIQGDGTISGGSRLTISDIADENNDGIRLDDSTTARFNNLTQDSSGNFKIQHWTGSAWQNNLTVTTGGNVGIGGSPNNWGGMNKTLELIGSSDVQLAIHANNDSLSDGDRIGEVAFLAGTTNTLPNVATIVGRVSGTAEAKGFLTFHCRDTDTAGIPQERMRITKDGNVGIGTSSPSTKLEVSGASNSTATFIKPQGALPDNNDNAGLYVLHQGTAGTGLRVRTDNALTGSNFAHILVNNASASINAFQVSQYGSGLIAKFDKSGTTAMQIDNSGAVTKPLQPAFLAKITSQQSDIATSTQVTVLFATEIYDQNSDYNTSTYTFTAPVTGKYQFNILILVSNMDSAPGYYQTALLTSNRTYYHTIDPRGFDTDISYKNMNTSILADMDAGDTAIVRIYQAGGTQQTDLDAESYFTGYLVA